MADAPRARPGSPASASSPAWARAPRRIGKRCSAAAAPLDATTFAPYIVHQDARRSTSTSRSPKRATSARWSRGNGSAPMRPAWRSTAAGVKGNAELLARMDMIVAAGGGERDIAVDAAILSRPAAGAANPRPSSTNG